MSTGIYNKFTGYHNRRSIRLPGYDYSQPGYYFVTVCIHDRKQNLFGNVVDGIMVLNEFGKHTEQCWHDIPKHFPNVKIDDFIAMPNHVHGIIRICGNPAGANVFVGANDYSPLREQTTPETGTPHARNDYSPLREQTTPETGTPHAPNDYSPLREQTTPETGTPYAPNDYSPIHTKQIHPCGTSKTVGSIVRGFKIGVSKMFRKHSPDKIVWQRGYYDHIIRDEKSLFFIRKYIRGNPMNWRADSENHIDHEIQEFEMSETGSVK